MGSIKDKVAVIGMGCTRFGEMWDRGDSELAVEACYEALEDAGIEPKDVEAVWYGTVYGGLTGTRFARTLKLDYVPVARVENMCATGTEAFRSACYAVAAGIYDIVLACGVEKLKDSGAYGMRVGIEADNRSRIETAVPAPVQFSLFANKYFNHYGLSYDDGKKTLAKIAVKNHHNGTLNAKAHFREEITVEQAINAPMVAHPLGVFDCCGVTDGAAAAIITRPEIAKDIRKDYVLVKAIASVVGAQQGLLQSNYDFVHFEENVRASLKAYAEAGIKDPRKELDLAIVHDCFTITELIIYEDLGFSKRGRGKEDVDEGTFTLEGQLPVNTDGGLKSFGHPMGASGLRMIYEVYKQLQGKAGLRQVKNAKLGLTHNLGGLPGAFVAYISILGSK
jgi:acetyl-CoA C-acetyltransferase